MIQESNNGADKGLELAARGYRVIADDIAGVQLRLDSFTDNDYELTQLNDYND